MTAFKCSHKYRQGSVPVKHFFLQYFRKVFFDLILEKQVFVHGMERLEDAVSSFLHLCFVANLQFPKGSGILCTFLQRWVAKLDEHGTTAASSRKDLANKEDKAGRSFKKAFDDYAIKLFVLNSRRF
jgi:hypothetical protein